MKNTLLLIVFLFLSSHLTAQPDNWYFSISMGGCWPVGSFANTNPAKTDAGFALKGFALNLDATYPLGTNWGLKGMVMLNNNPVDRNGMGTMMEYRMKKLVPFTEAERENLTLTVNSWMSNSLIFGPVFTLNFDRFAWDFQAMAGMNVTYLPNQKLLFKNTVNNWEYLQHNTNSVNVSYGLLAGSALRMKVTEKINLKLAMDFQYSRSKTNYEELKTTKLNNTTTTEQLNSGSTVVPKEAVIGSIGFVYYL
ncbi:MAG: hypothetical protein M1445_12030 [Bacteroidetes bacterium]|nr:hypothetical protein [Bacteroidota bacterium]MCL6102283.1 hypothetical protein [Bacteroidota bacterium]